MRWWGIEMRGRCQCAVPFCTHTRGPRKGDREALTPTTQWLCDKHWRAVPLKMRQAYHRRENWERGDPYRRKGAPAWVRERPNDDGSWRLWERIKREAIQRAMGI